MLDKRQTAILLSPAILILLALGTGCGTQSAYSTHHSLNASQDSSNSNSGTSGSGTSPYIAAAVTTGVAPYSFAISGVGYNSASVQVKTRSILKIKFTPGLPNQMISGTGYTAKYSALGVYIQVGTTSDPTPLLQNGYAGGKAETGPVMDFSTAFSGTCTASDTTCHQTVSIIVKQPNSDDACYWSNYEQYGCASSSYYHQLDGHPWNGTLTVQTDDTDPI